METFTMEIAKLAVRIEPLFVSTREYCRPYLTDREPDFTVHVSRDDLTFEQRMLDLEADQEGLKRRKFTDPFLERTAIQRKVADRLLLQDTLLIHGSAVAVDGMAYLFIAPCGTGKSTHTKLWRELFGDRAVMINDDKPFLQITSSGAFAYGSPWSGKHGLGSNICAGVKGICYLHRGQENRICSMNAADAISQLCHQAHASVDPLLQQKTEQLVIRLAEKVPLWEMDCNKELEAAIVSYTAMSAGE